MKAYLVLEDGAFFEGETLQPVEDVYGELIFNTSMTGYQEILTNPSYKGQMVVMTYPLIGNYGFNHEDSESDRVHMQALIVKELCSEPSNWRCEETPVNYLNRCSIPILYDIDTRELTHHIRRHGSMRSVLSNRREISTLVKSIKQQPEENRDLIGTVSTSDVCHYPGSGKRIAVLDLGVKQNIIHSLQSRNLDILITPASFSPSELIALEPDGILLSGGPGSPQDASYALSTIRTLTDSGIPMMGIGLGYQLLGMALGGEAYKLKSGHHGSNHPVKDVLRNRVYITSQNHNYALGEHFDEGVCITHKNMNDGSVEGFHHQYRPLSGIQYDPNPSSGALDCARPFYEFLEIVDAG